MRRPLIVSRIYFRLQLFSLRISLFVMPRGDLGTSPVGMTAKITKEVSFYLVHEYNADERQEDPFIMWQEVSDVLYKLWKEK